MTDEELREAWLDFWQRADEGITKRNGYAQQGVANQLRRQREGMHTCSQHPHNRPLTPGAGACCCRPESHSHSFQSATLRWVWIHPYQRRGGVLSRAWETLRANHGDFFVEPPFSPAMLSFVRKHTRDSQFYDTYRGWSGTA
jgi:hypothetical protein